MPYKQPSKASLQGILVKKIELSLNDIIFTNTPKFIEFIAGTVLLAHNAQFDLRLVNAECERLNIEPLKNKGIDTLRLSRILLPENQCWKLSHLSAQFNLQTENFHRAYDDALCCAKLFLHLLTLPLPKNIKKRHAEMKIKSSKSTCLK